MTLLLRDEGEGAFFVVMVVVVVVVREGARVTEVAAWRRGVGEMKAGYMSEGGFYSGKCMGGEEEGGVGERSGGGCVGGCGAGDFIFLSKSELSRGGGWWRT